MAGRIPQNFINDLIDRLDIVDVVERYVTLKKTGKNYSGLCPFHDEKTPSFSVSPDKQFFHCFGCQESGTALTFVMKFERLEFVETVEMLAQQLGLEVPRERGLGPEKKVDTGLYDVLASTERFYRQSLKGADHAVEYLKQRGLTGEIARDFGIGYAPEGWQNLMQGLDGANEEKLIEAGLVIRNENGRTYDRFRDRVMFPIRDTRGRVIGFGGRKLAGVDGPKYLNSPETPVFHKGNELYGLYEARKALRSIDKLIVVEGYMDVVALAQFGIANTVATLGTATGTGHFQKLYRYTDEIVCCFDGDSAGRQAAWKALDNALPALNEKRQLKFIFLDDGEDPDSLIRVQGGQHFQGMVEHALGALEFLLQRLTSGLDLDSLDGRARFAGLAAPYVERIPEGLLREMVAQRVRELAGMESASGSPRVPRSQPRAILQAFNKVSERLLTLVVKHPGFWFTVDAESREDLLRADEEEFIPLVLRYIDENPETDTEELLVRFADAPISLATLAAKPMEIDATGLAREFPELCELYLRNIQAQQRKKSLQQLKASPNIDELRKFWDEREGGKS